MRYVLACVVVVSGLALAGMACAADPATSSTEATHVMNISVARANDLIGLAVWNSNNEKLGKIHDIVLDPSSGKIRYAVLSFGGFLGMGDKLFAVPWNDLTFHIKGTTRSGMLKEDYAILPVTKEALKDAPGFDKNSWPDFADSQFVLNVEKFYSTQRSASRATTPR
jgi:sporulation protein YlmC with PRC-barrel domain